MYCRLCVANDEVEAGRIHSLLRSHGLLPLTRNLSTHIQCYSIELPDDELEKGRRILAESKREKGSVR